MNTLKHTRKPGSLNHKELEKIIEVLSVDFDTQELKDSARDLIQEKSFAATFKHPLGKVAILIGEDNPEAIIILQEKLDGWVVLSK